MSLVEALRDFRRTNSRRLQWIRGFAWVLMLLAASAGGSLRAEGGVSIAGAKVGVAGLYHVGAWTEIRVTTEGVGDKPVLLEIEAPDPDDTVVTYRQKGVKPVGGEVRGIFKTGRMQYDLVVRLKDEEGELLAERKFRAGSEEGNEIGAGLPFSTKVWIGVGNPAGFEEAATETAGDLTFEKRRVESIEELPTDWNGYQGVDAVVIPVNGTDKNQQVVREQFAKGSPQGEALRQWVANGGVVLLSVGKDLEKFRGSGLGEWSPVMPRSEESLRLFAPLQTLGGKPLRFDGTVPMTQVETEPRRVVLRGATFPLVVEAPYQFGRVYFCSLDLDQEPFVGWEGLSRFYSSILTRGSAKQDQTESGGSGRLSTGGISELASQFTRGISSIEGVNRTSLWGNLLFLLVYLLVVGPLDYLIVCRWLKRPEWTWVTLPLILLGAGGAGLIYARSSNGESLRTRSVSVVDFDSKSNRVHGRNWSALYSPETRRVSITTSPKPMTEVTAGSSANRLGWWSLPEGSIGGLYRSSGVQFARREYGSGPNPDELVKAPVQIWSTRIVESEWTAEEKAPVTSKLESTGVGNLQGAVTWTLSEPLKDCMLVYGNRVYFPRAKRGSDSAELAANFVWEPGVATQTSQRELRGFLTKLQTRTVVKRIATADQQEVKEVETVASSYDALSRNLDDILPILCFFEYAGGSGYTQLRNDMLGRMDWSHQLRMGEAVLYGRIEGGGVTLSLDGKEPPASGEQQKATYVRCLLPVTRVQGRDLRDFSSPVQEAEEKQQQKTEEKPAG